MVDELMTDLFHLRYCKCYPRSLIRNIEAVCHVRATVMFIRQFTFTPCYLNVIPDFKMVTVVLQILADLRVVDKGGKVAFKGEIRK